VCYQLKFFFRCGDDLWRENAEKFGQNYEGFEVMVGLFECISEY
jgi:hypothetical protein